MSRPTFEVEVTATDTGDEVRVSRNGPFDYVLAAQINKRLAEHGASLALAPTRGWFLRSGQDRSALDRNTELTNTLVLVRELDGAAA